MGSDILNLAAALERVGGDSDFLGEVAQLFLDSAPEMLAQVRDAAKTRDARALQRSAHTLKGSVGNFGAAPTVRAALRLEQMGRAQQLDGVEEAYAALEQEMVRLQPALTALGAKSGV